MPNYEQPNLTRLSRTLVAACLLAFSTSVLAEETIMVCEDLYSARSDAVLKGKKEVEQSGYYEQVEENIDKSTECMFDLSKELGEAVGNLNIGGLSGLLEDLLGKLGDAGCSLGEINVVDNPKTPDFDLVGTSSMTGMSVEMPKTSGGLLGNTGNARTQSQQPTQSGLSVYDKLSQMF